MSKHDAPEEYLRFLPPGWSADPYPQGIHDLHEAMQAANTARLRFETWEQEPRVMSLLNGVQAVYDPNVSARTPNHEELSKVQTDERAKLQVLDQEVIRQERELYQQEIDPYVVLGLPTTATPEQVFAAFTTLDREIIHYMREMADIMKDQRSKGNTRTKGYVNAHWQIVAKMIAQDRVRRAHHQLAATIGSKQPSRLWRVIRSLF